LCRVERRRSQSEEAGGGMNFGESIVDGVIRSYHSIVRYLGPLAAARPSR
jgi:hypothetical protein